MIAEGGIEGDGTGGLIPPIHSALRCVSSASSSPGSVRQAQDALSTWEETRVDDYVVVLLHLVGMSSSSDEATLRLAAILALKATIARRWKDRGRGGGSRAIGGGGASVATPPTLMSEDVKANVRRSLLNLTLAGRIEDVGDDDKIDLNAGGDRRCVVAVADPGEITSRQLELLRDRSLQRNASALLARIARMDLPLKFHDLIPTLVEGVSLSQGAVCRITQQQHLHQHQHTQQQAQQLLQKQVHDIMILRTILYNAMNCLDNILTELSTQRLLVNKKYRNSISLQYLGSIVEAGWMPSLLYLESSYENGSGSGSGGGGGGVDASTIEMMVQYATFASRVVSDMMSSSFSKLLVDDVSTSPLVDYVLTNVHSFLSRWLPRALIDDGSGTSHISPHGKDLNELVLVHCDLIVNLQRSHSKEFVSFVDPFLALFHSSLMCTLGIDIAVGFNTSNVDIQSSNRYAIVFMTFLANVVGCFEIYDLRSFFLPSLVKSMSRTLLELMPIHIYCRNDEDDCDENDEDIEGIVIRWQDDPEGFYHYEIQRSSENDLGCASQNLFLALTGSSFTNQIVIHLLKEMFQNVTSQRMAVDIESGVSSSIDAKNLLSALPLGHPMTKFRNKSIDPSVELILQWDSVFTAVGLVGGVLEDYWFESNIGQCLALLLQSEPPRQRAHLPILLRRMIWLISCNAQRITISSQLVGLLTTALSAENDICVRLTTVLAFETLLPHCESSLSKMPPISAIVEATAPALYRLTNECQEVDSRSSCLDLISNLIVCVNVTGGTLSNDILDAIIAPLPAVWRNAVNQNLLLKRNVLTILSCIATFVGPDQAVILHPLALPMIDDCFGREENAFLVGEALKAWWLFVRLSKTYDGMLAKLFIRAVELSRDLENLIILMRITEHYIILGGIDFLNEHSTAIQRVLCNVVGEVRPRGASFIFMVVEALLVTGGPIQGGQLLQSCGLLATLVDACAHSYFEDEKSEPDRVIVLYLTVLARISFSSPMILASLFPLKHPSGAIFGERELVCLLLMKFQAAGNGAHGLLFQKLWVLLLLSFYPPCNSVSYCNIVLGKSNEIFDRFIYMLRNLSPDGTNLLSFAVECDEGEETLDVGIEMYETLLRDQRAKDELLSMSLHKAISAKLSALHNELGDRYIEFISTIDGDTLQQLERVLDSNI